MKEPVWLRIEAFVHLHDVSIARFGGSEGLRDKGLLESALDRPINVFNYRDEIDLADLAASYAYGLSQNHPFVDGNKRAALLACGVFLEMNGWKLVADPADTYRAVVTLAAGKITEGEFAEWIRQNRETEIPR